MEKEHRRLPWTVVRVAPDAVHLLRFVLEAHDHAFVLTTLDRRMGLVRIAYVEQEAETLRAILQELEERLGLRC